MFHRISDVKKMMKLKKKRGYFGLACSNVKTEGQGLYYGLLAHGLSGAVRDGEITGRYALYPCFLLWDFLFSVDFSATKEWPLAAF